MVSSHLRLLFTFYHTHSYHQQVSKQDGLSQDLYTLAYKQVV